MTTDEEKKARAADAQRKYREKLKGKKLAISKENRRLATLAYRERKKAEGINNHCFLLTEAEFQAVLELLKSMRS